VIARAAEPPVSAKAESLAIAGVTLAALAVYVGLAPDALMNGDAAFYARQIAERSFSRPAIHLGYFVLGFLFTNAVPLAFDHALNVMNGLSGALAVGVACLLARALGGGRVAASASGLFLASNMIYMVNSAFAEVYTPQLFFVLLALYLWIRERIYSAGAAFAAALLVSPVSALALPVFVTLRPRWRPLLRFALAAVVPAALILLPFREDFLFGGRGVLAGVSAAVSVPGAIRKEGFEVFHGFLFTLPYVVAGGSAVLREKRLRAFGLGIALTWALTFLLGETTGDVPVQLPTYALLAVAAGLGLERLARSGARVRWTHEAGLPALVSLGLLLVVVVAARGTRGEPSSTAVVLFVLSAGVFAGSVFWLHRRGSSARMRALPVILGAVLVLGLNAGTSLRRTGALAGTLVALKQDVLAMDEVARPGYLVVAGFNEGMLCEWYAFGDVLTGRWLHVDWLTGTGAWGESKHEEAIETWNRAVERGDEIWLLGEFPAFAGELEEEGYTTEPFRGFTRASPSRG
jgi:hypothetical protein